MKNKLIWFKILPFGFALRLFILYAVRKVFNIHVVFSFSRGAEDVIINDLFTKKKGTYIDVGCNDPVIFSNTFGLYLDGWRGLNIDANNDLIEKCRKIRKKDISICTAISNVEKEVIFHKSVNHQVSTIDENRKKDWSKRWEFNPDDQQMMVTQTLTSVFKKAFPQGTPVDLLSIDVEGHEFEVLEGINFTVLRPFIIIIEIHSLDDISNSKIYKYLMQKGYVFRGYALLNAYFVDGNADK